MIEVSGLTKRYGSVTAVDDVSFAVKPGVVTGFLGPNGAGKSTTMRMILGLDRPTAGTATIAGKQFAELRRPGTVIGALLDSRQVHPRRPAAKHLRWVAAASGLPASRVDEVLDLVGLTDVAGKPAGGFSTGMAQRLGLAQALLGDPEYLVLDEPTNGLDPEGIRWNRDLLRSLADEGRTILMSSHLLSEMAMTADNLVVIGRGKLIADTTVDEFVDGTEQSSVLVRAADLEALAAVLGTAGFTPSPANDERGRPVLRVAGATADRVGLAAFDGGIALTELLTEHRSLEDAYMASTGDDVQYQGGNR